MMASLEKFQHKSLEGYLKSLRYSWRNPYCIFLKLYLIGISKCGIGGMFEVNEKSYLHVNVKNISFGSYNDTDSMRNSSKDSFNFFWKSFKSLRDLSTDFFHRFPQDFLQDSRLEYLKNVTSNAYRNASKDLLGFPTNLTLWNCIKFKPEISGKCGKYF